MVLQGQGNYQHVEQVFHSVPHEILPYEQNQCPKVENFKFPAEYYGIHPRGVGEAARIHPYLPTPRDGKLASPLKLLQWVNPHVKRTH